MTNWRHIDGILWTLLALLALATVAGFFGAFAWWLDVIANFRLPYAGAAATVFLVGLVFRRWRFAGLAAITMVANLYTLAPLVETAEIAKVKSKIVSINLHWRNKNPSRAIAFLHREDADVVILTEVTDNWQHALAEFDAKYPYRFSSPRYKEPGDLPHSIMILSKRPWQRAGMIKVPRGRRVFAVWAQFGAGASELRVYGIHLVSPFWAVLEDQIEDAARLTNALGRYQGETVLAGDFNMTPFSSIYRKLMARLGLVRAGGGYNASFPSYLGPFGLPIDHVMTRVEGGRAEMRIGPDLGSDHLPVVARLNIAIP